MKKYILIILSLFLASPFMAQTTKIYLQKAQSNRFELGTTTKGENVLELNTSLSYVSASVKSTDSGNFITLESEGLMETFNSGKPDIPVYSKLIEVPLEATVNFTVISYDEEIIDLNTKGISEKVIPAQPSVFKDEEPTTFYYDQNTYNKNSYFNTTVAEYEEAGILRSARLGKIIVNPIQYNPVSNRLRVLNNLKIEIRFVGSNTLRTSQLKSKYSSSLFDGMVEKCVLNPAVRTSAANSEAATYAIVADRMFESTLAPFIAYKKSLGYKVIIGYTDSPEIGKTTASIKAYLQNLYQNPPVGYDPPLYALLVGDVQQIPAFRSEYHFTDLYYFDYTDDNLPDVFYGRFSAQNVAQLQPQIDKTLEYEKYTMPDPTYLYNAVLVAGKQSGCEIYTNGQVNYAKDTYCNPSNGITAYAYLQPEPVGANYSAEIISKINSGVGLANYTAHCDENGWANPSFNKSDIPALTNVHKYGLWIGNCCLSGKFDVTECFGEAVLRASNKGAVGYIGASDYTTWSEDFYWAVGFKKVAYNPVYDSDHLGAYDKMFHTHGEPTSEWCMRQGQINIAGNLAVQESTSTRIKYYWEVYHLFGDPSLNIRFTSPVNCEENLVINTDINGGNHHYLAEKTITASNTISGGATVHYGANQHVTLNGGFNVEKGSAINIDLNGCTNSSSMMSKSPNNSPKENTGNLNNGTSLSENTEENYIRVQPDPFKEGAYTLEIDNKDAIPESVVIVGQSGSTVYRNCNHDKVFTIRNIAEKGDILVRINFLDNYIVKKVNICKTNK